MIQHFIWDFDGTLFDTYPVMAKTFQDLLLSLGIEESIEDISKNMQITMKHAMEYYQNKYHLDDSLLKEFRYLSKQNELNSLPFEGITEICKSISIQGKHNYLYTHRGDSAIALLKKHNLYQYFTDFITGKDTFKRKPEPDAIIHLIQKHHLNKEETLMIGDRDLDILAGKNAGIKTCYYSKTNTFERADYQVQSLLDILSIIE